jgi:AcrR family transcriptional regulator
MAIFPTIEELRIKHIIEASLSAISARGVSNITMRDLAKAAGLSNGGLAHYFPSKEILFKAVFKEFFQRIFKHAKEELARISDPMERLMGFSAFFDVDDPNVPVGYPLLFDCMSMAVHNQQYKKLFEEWLENWILLLRAAIEEGVKKKMFLKKIDADAVARMISSIYLGISIRWYLARGLNSTEWAMKAFKESIAGLMEPYRI